MSRSRSKQVVLTRDEASDALARAGELGRQIAEIDTKLARRTARIKELAVKKAEDLKKELGQLGKRLDEFYDAHPELLDGDSRTVVLPSGALQKRLGNWTTHLSGEIEEDPERHLPPWARRTITVPNREAMLEHPELAVLIVGVGIDRIERLHLLPNGETTGINGPARKIRFGPDGIAA